MRYLRAALARLAGVFTKDATDDDMRDELEAHVELATAENVRRGMAPEEARRQALLAAGGLTQAVEAVRDQRGLPWIESIASDLRYAVRSLRHAPGFTLVVVVTLALGIGANTAIFSVVRGVLLKPLPHRDGDRLMYLRHSQDGPGGGNITFSVPEVRDIRQGAPSFEGIAEYSDWRMTYQGHDGAARIQAGLVTGNFFEVMGLSTILGRVTGPQDDGPGVPPVMVLTHDWWRKAFGADSSIVGKQVTVDGRSVTVIGVLQPAPFFPGKADALFNMVNSEHHLSAFMVEGRTHRMTEMVARLGRGATVAQARNEVETVTARVQRENPDAYNPTQHHRVSVIPFREVMGERARLTLFLLMGAALFVMIISAASVANLTLMRGVRRQHELAVRVALGSGSARLRRLLLAENVLLALGGAAAGIVVAIGGVRLLTAFAERYSPRANEIALDGVVLTFTLALAGSVAVLLSYIASVPQERGLAAWVLAGARRISAGVSRQRLQRGLVVLQIAVSVMLLAGAGLLTRTMLQLSDVRTGLRTEEVLTLAPTLAPFTELARPGGDARIKQLAYRIRDEIAALPGVIAVGIGSPLPLRSSEVRFDVAVEGRPTAAGEAPPRAEMRIANPDFFEASGIPLANGRTFGSMDGPASGNVVVINQALADRLFPGEDPVGRRIAWAGRLLRFTPITDEWRTVIGVVANTQDGGPENAPQLAVYMPFAQALAMGTGFVVRADSNVASLSAAVTRVIRRNAPTAPIENVLTIPQYKDRNVSPRRLNAILVSSFGILAVIIAAVGIAGVLAFSVSARANEIGIRMSLGASRGRVQRMILREGGALVLLGLSIGVGGAFVGARAIQGLLFGITPHDPMTFGVVAMTMAAIGVLACWIPALRASRIDPAVSMRS